MLGRSSVWLVMLVMGAGFPRLCWVMVTHRDSPFSVRPPFLPLVSLYPFPVLSALTFKVVASSYFIYPPSSC